MLGQRWPGALRILDGQPRFGTLASQQGGGRQFGSKAVEGHGLQVVASGYAVQQGAYGTAR